MSRTAYAFLVLVTLLVLSGLVMGSVVQDMTTEIISARAEALEEE